MDIRNFKKANNTTAPKAEKSASGITQLLNKDISLNSKFNNKDKERFFLDVGMLLTAGIDLQTALELSVSGSDKNKKLNKVYVQVLDSVTSGSSLAEAMEQTKQFNDFDCYSVQIGEATGELKSIFNRLHSFYKKKIAQRRKIINALSYPAIVLITTIGAVIFMLKFVVPMFAETLSQFGGDLPYVTKVVLSLSDKITKYFMVLLLLAISIGVYYSRYRHKEYIKKATSTVLLKIPYVGKLVRNMNLAQMAETLSLLLSSNINILESLRLTQKMINFYPIYKALNRIQEDLVEGETLYNCMKQEPIFDNQLINIVKIGEEINQLDTTFGTLAMQLQNEIDYQSSLLVSILEPLMIIFLAIVVGFILISMYLPMFKIGSTIG